MKSSYCAQVLSYVCFLLAECNTVDVSVFLLVMEIADLRSKLKKAQKLANKAAKQNTDGLSIFFYYIVSAVSPHIILYFSCQ